MANSSTARGGRSPSMRLAVRASTRSRARRPLFFRQRRAIVSIGVSRLPAVIDHVAQDLTAAVTVIVMLAANLTHDAQDLGASIAGRVTLRGKQIIHRSKGADNTISHRQGVG